MVRNLELWLEAVAGCSVPPGCYAAPRSERAGAPAVTEPLVRCQSHRASRLCGIEPGAEPSVIDVFQLVGSISLGQLQAGLVGEATVPWPGSTCELGLRVAVAEAGKAAFPDATKDPSMNTILEVQPFLEDLEVAVLKAENLARIAELDLGAITSTKRPSMDAEPAQTLIELARQASGEAFVELTRQPSGLSEADSAFLNEGHPNKLARMTTIDIAAKEEENDTKLYKPVMLNNCDQILPFLYLGGVDAVADTQCVVNQGIRAVVCCLRELEFPTKEFSKDLEYYRVDVEDISREPIDLFFPEATEFIHSWISREQPVLVHCRAGVSRSASVVMSYLVTYQGYSLHDAFFLVRSHRPIVSPNLGFMEKLCEYEEAKKDTDSTVDINKYISWYTTPESSRAAVPDLVPE